MEVKAGTGTEGQAAPGQAQGEQAQAWGVAWGRGERGGSLAIQSPPLLSPPQQLKGQIYDHLPPNRFCTWRL